MVELKQRAGCCVVLCIVNTVQLHTMRKIDNRGIGVVASLSSLPVACSFVRPMYVLTSSNFFKAGTTWMSATIRFYREVLVLYQPAMCIIQKLTYDCTDKLCGCDCTVC